MIRITAVLLDAEMNVVPQHFSVRQSWMMDKAEFERYTGMEFNPWNPKNIATDLVEMRPHVCSYVDVKIDTFEHNSNVVVESKTHSYEVRGRTAYRI